MPIFRAPNQSIRWLFAELTVVIVGILIAFQVEEWRDTSNNRALVFAGLDALLLELSDEGEVLERFANRAEAQASASREIVNRILQDEEIEEDWLIQTYRQLISGLSWQPHNATYSSLLDSGNLYLLENSQLETELFLYYESQQFTEFIIAGSVDRANQLRSASLRDIHLVPALSSERARTAIHIAKPIEDFPRNSEFVGAVGNFGSIMVAVARRTRELREMNDGLRDSINAELDGR